MSIFAHSPNLVQFDGGGGRRGAMMGAMMLWSDGGGGGRASRGSGRRMEIVQERTGSLSHLKAAEAICCLAGFREQFRGLLGIL